MENKELRKYIRCIKKELICSSSMKRSYSIEIENRIRSYEEENGELTVETLYAVFGSPKEIASGFFTKGDLDYLKKKSQKYKKAKMLITGLLIILVLSIIITAVVVLTDENIVIERTHVESIWGVIL